MVDSPYQLVQDFSNQQYLDNLSLLVVNRTQLRYQNRILATRGAKSTTMLCEFPWRGFGKRPKPKKRSRSEKGAESFVESFQNSLQFYLDLLLCLLLRI